MKEGNQFTRFVIKIWGMILILQIIISCASDRNDQELEEYLASYNEWKSERVNSLKSPNGWLNLAGLFWLEEGENRFGSDSSNTIIFPPVAPAVIGSIILEKNKITLFVDAGIPVSQNGETVQEIELLSDYSGKPTLLTLDSLAWFIIKRGDRYGIRLRDYNHPNIDKLDSIPHFPVDLVWKVSATFEPFIQPRMISVPNIIGTIEESPVPGLLKFQIGEQELTLYPMGDPDHLFLVFGDETSALETYGGGRFLSVDPPDEKGNYTIDLNRAYNPPCAFTLFATCPLPPRENFLPIRVTAGEKVVEGFGHH
jgi:uncharacterized protein (DUF1684 family)